MDLRQLKHKYSHGPIPQWELDRLAGKVAENRPNRQATEIVGFSGALHAGRHGDVSKPRRGRPPKSVQVVSDGDGNTDRD